MMFIIRTTKYFQLHLLTMVFNGKPGKTTHKYSLKKNELKICLSNLHQHLSQNNKPNHKTKPKKNNKNTTVVLWTKGFVVKFLFLFQIVNANPSSKFLLQIHIVNSYCKCLSYILIANYCNCNASLVNVAG